MWSVPDTPEAVREAVARLEPLFVLFAVIDCFEAIHEHAHVLGSLRNPDREARDYFARTYHRDPPLFRAWLLAELWRYIRAGCSAARFLSESPSPVPDAQGELF